jgi:hypothetical protein
MPQHRRKDGDRQRDFEEKPSPELSRTQHFVIQHGRKALADAIQQVAPPGQALPLITVAAVGLFTDLISVSPAANQLLGVINTRLRQVGLELVQVTAPLTDC